MSDKPSAIVRSRGIALLAAIGLVVAACGAPPSSESSGGGRGSEVRTDEDSDLPECPLEALDAVEDEGGTVEIDIWYGGIGGSPEAVMKSMVSEFNKSQSVVKAVGNSQGTSYDEVLRKYGDLASTPKSLPDIIYLEDRALGEIVDRGQVLPAEACMEAAEYDPTQLEAVARSSFSVDGVLYPGYMNVSTPVLYYNKVHFTEAGLDPEDPPGTIDELIEAARILKEKGVSKQPLAFKSEVWFFSNWLSGAGGEDVNNDNGRKAAPTEATFNTDESLEILTKFQEMAEEGLAAVYPVTEGSINHYLALAQENSSMVIETSTATSTIRDFLGGDLDAEAAGESFADADIDFAKTRIVPGAGALPGLRGPGKVYAGGGAFYILNTSSPEKQAASWRFLEFMLQPEQAFEWHTNGGYLPVVKAVLDEPEVEEFWSTDVAGVMLKKAVDQLRSADPDQPGPLMGPFAGYKDIMNGMIYQVVGDARKDPQAALDDAEKKVDDLLGDYND